MTPGSLHHREGAADALLLMLPGALMTPQHMQDAGLFDAVRAQGLALHVSALNLHIDTTDHTVALSALAQQVLPQAKGEYARVWLGGVSLGGLLALAHAVDHPGQTDGLCLLAPYPGSRVTTNAIATAGGLDAWVPSAAQASDPEYRVWHGVKNLRVTGPVFFGYGEHDRFAPSMRALAQQLPQAEVRHQAGGHDWAVWLPLWTQFLQMGYFPKAAP